MQLKELKRMKSGPLWKEKTNYIHNISQLLVSCQVTELHAFTVYHHISNGLLQWTDFSPPAHQTLFIFGANAQHGPMPDITSFTVKLVYNAIEKEPDTFSSSVLQTRPDAKVYFLLYVAFYTHNNSNCVCRAIKVVQP